MGSCARDMAVYSWPCAKNSVQRYSPTCVSPCPWDLSAVIAYAKAKGNCRRHRVHVSLCPGIIAGAMMSSSLFLLVVSFGATMISGHTMFFVVGTFPSLPAS